MPDELTDAIDRAMGVATFGMTAGTSEYVLRGKRVQAAAQAAREFYKIPESAERGAVGKAVEALRRTRPRSGYGNTIPAIIRGIDDALRELGEEVPRG